VERRLFARDFGNPGRGEDDTMADRNGLRLVGWFYGGVTAIIGLIALVVVSAHLNTPVEARPETVTISAR
jgi:hypothetical protein